MITLENLPYISLGVVGMGFVIVILGVVLLANNQEGNVVAIKQEGTEQEENNIEELFAYFLQEEKKNSALRRVLHKGYSIQKNQRSEEGLIKEITSQHDEGKAPEEIAKNLYIGVGEVNLILSLYSMR